MGASPLTEILNYVTAISFNSFEYAESKFDLSSLLKSPEQNRKTQNMLCLNRIYEFTMFTKGDIYDISKTCDLKLTIYSFNAFVCLEMNCNYIMSSFGEEKGLNFIKSKPKEFVRYNVRQNSRVYPAGGSRMNSSNYMPQVSYRRCG